MPDGQTPHTVSLCAYDELVDLVKPGDRVMITGIFRSIPVRQNPRQRSIKALFKTYVDVVHIKRTNVARMGYDPSTRDGAGRPPGVGVGGEDDEDEGLSAADRMAVAEGEGMNVDGENAQAPSANAEMERKLRELSEREDVYELLSRSMAPSIWEMDDVKKGILLQLFGGTNKSISRGGGGGGPRYRGDINVLMVGDPGTSKSQILTVGRGHPILRCILLTKPPAVRPQDRPARCLHLRQGILGRRSHGIYYSRPGLEAACARVGCTSLV